MNKEIIKEIKETDFLSRVFEFKSDDEKDFLTMFKSKREMKKYSDIQWLYLSNNKFASLIGITGENFVFAIDEDFDKDIFSFSFFDIPFSFFRLSVTEVGKSWGESLSQNDAYRNDLEKYVEWCNKNGHKLEKREVKLLNDSLILKSKNDKY